MPLLRLAYTTLFLIALIAIFTAWAQVGGQGHFDLVPWHLKLVLGVAAAYAVVKAASASVSREPAWNGTTVKWFGILLALLLAAGVVTYYMHVYGEQDEEDQPEETISLHLTPTTPPGYTALAG
jgi:hypothetical protein